MLLLLPLQQEGFRNVAGCSAYTATVLRMACSRNDYKGPPSTISPIWKRDSREFNVLAIRAKTASDVDAVVHAGLLFACWAPQPRSDGRCLPFTIIVDIASS